MESPLKQVSRCLHFKEAKQSTSQVQSVLDGCVGCEEKAGGGGRCWEGDVESERSLSTSPLWPEAVGTSRMVSGGAGCGPGSLPHLGTCHLHFSVG